MTSIYHFFKNLVEQKNLFSQTIKLEDFPFNTDLLSCKNIGIFPDLAIKVNQDKNIFTGGELIELKDCKGYNVSSFNSTIPTAMKNINEIIKGKDSGIRRQMIECKDDIDSLPERTIYYLVRGKKTNFQKIVLVHGSFFETVKKKDLISKSFSQILSERLKESGKEITQEVELLLTEMFSEQENFSKVRDVEKSSVKLRFRIMTEVKVEGNILNTNKYPEIKDNSLNLILPYHTDEDRNTAWEKMKIVFGSHELKQFKEIKLKHLFNGYFVVFQTTLTQF